MYFYFSGSVEYTEKSLNKALKLYESIDAGMGGTEILNALKSVYQRKPVKGFAKQASWNDLNIIYLICL